MAVPCAHFYDDLLSLGLNLGRGSGQHALKFIALEQGTVLDKDKHSALHPECVFVCSHVNKWHLFGQGKLIFSPKEGQTEKIVNIIKNAEASRNLGGTEAASLLGNLGHLGSTLSGRVLRGCEWQFGKVKDGKAASWSPELAASLCFARVAAMHLPPRVVKVRAGSSRPPLLLWSDAEFSGSAMMGFGWVLS